MNMVFPGRSPELAQQLNITEALNIPGRTHREVNINVFLWRHRCHSHSQVVDWVHNLGNVKLWMMCSEVGAATSPWLCLDAGCISLWSRIFFGQEILSFIIHLINQLWDWMFSLSRDTHTLKWLGFAAELTCFNDHLYACSVPGIVLATDCSSNHKKPYSPFQKKSSKNLLGRVIEIKAWLTSMITMKTAYEVC